MRHHDYQPQNQQQSEQDSRRARQIALRAGVTALSALIATGAVLATHHGAEAPRKAPTLTERFDVGPTQTELNKQITRDLVTKSSDDFRALHPAEAADLAEIGKQIIDSDNKNPQAGGVVLIEAPESFIRGDEADSSHPGPLNSSNLVGHIGRGISALATPDGHTESHSIQFVSYEETSEPVPADGHFTVQFATPRPYPYEQN